MNNMWEWNWETTVLWHQMPHEVKRRFPHVNPCIKLLIKPIAHIHVVWCCETQMYILENRGTYALLSDTKNWGHVNERYFIVFILSAMSPCTTGLNALYDPIQLYKYSPNSQGTDIPPKSERQQLKDGHLSTSLRFFSLPLGDRTQWQWTAILSGHLSHYVTVCAWVWTHALCVPRQACYQLGHSGTKILITS